MGISEEHIIRDEVAAFLTDRRSRQLTEGTIDYYAYYLDRLLNLLTGQGVTRMEDITPACLRSVFDTFGQTHNRGGTHCLFRTTRSFLIWYEDETDGAWRNPIRKLVAPKLKNDPIPGVTDEDVRRLVATCGRDWYGRRDRALLLFLYDSGVRLSECLALNLEDIDLETGTVRVLDGKGGKDRITRFGPETAGELRRYLRGRATDPPASPLWLDRTRGRLAPTGLRDMLVRRSRSAGLAEIPSAHDFRRGFAVAMLRAGADLLTVSRLLGHESLEVTRRYLALVDDDLARVHALASPVGRMKSGRHSIR